MLEATTITAVIGDMARAELAAEHQRPSGELRLAAPAGFTQHAAPALGQWLAMHPELRLRLLMDDAPIDLIQARVDLALRFGNLQDSSWVARHLGVRPEDIYCVGNGLNDIPMLAVSALSFAPANSYPEVRAAADVVLPSCDESCVARLIEHLEVRYDNR